MVCTCKRILPLCLFTVVVFSVFQMTSYAQVCRIFIARPGNELCQSGTGRCSPVKIGSGSTGTCKVVSGKGCTCVGTLEPSPTPTPSPTPALVPLRGFVDLHTHPMANLGFGGKLFYGGVDVGSLLPRDPDCNHNVRATSEQQALGHDKSTHGGHDFLTNSCGDEIRKGVIHALQSGLNGADETEDAVGYPTFAEWPVWNDLTHQKMWVEWVRRAYTGGLRVMVALALNNKTLGDMTAGPFDYPTDDKSSADLQIIEIKSFVGRHPDFMEVAYNSNDVYRIVSANKLAVVIGIEVDHMGNLKAGSEVEINAEVDRLYEGGVRYIFPIHLLDNALGGSAAYVPLFNVSNMRENGRPYKLVCASITDDIDFVYNNNDLSFENMLAQFVKTGVAILYISYPPCQPGQSRGQKNSLGLTPAGPAAIKHMMRRGMLIDIDHMSQAATDQTLEIAKSFGYPVNSGHNGLRGVGTTNHNERALRADQYLIIGQLHGMAGVGSENLDSQTWLNRYNMVMQAMGGGSIVGGFGTDTNGFARGMPLRPGTHPVSIGPGPQLLQYQQCFARHCLCFPDSKGHPNSSCIQACNASKASCRKQFPNLSAPVPAVGIQYSDAFPPSTDGNMTWDLKSNGVAHFGMLWDFLEDVKLLPGGAAMVDNNFMNGAEYFFQTWKIAETMSATVK